MAKGKYQKWLEPENLTLITGWTRNGLTDEQVAYNMGISRKTLYEWQNKFSCIRDALKSGKEVVDLQVENALLKRALGYSYDEVTIENGVETKRVTKEVAPESVACIFWLKNRKPKEWRDKVENVNENHTTVDFSKLTTEQIKGMLDDEV